MTWTSGYVRSADRGAWPHPWLRDRPAFVIQHVARTMRMRVEQELHDCGLSWSRFCLLLVASAIGDPPQQALATKAAVDRNTASALLADLEYDGYVERCPYDLDRRHVQVLITPSARCSAGWTRASGTGCRSC